MISKPILISLTPLFLISIFIAKNRINKYLASLVVLSALIQLFILQNSASIGLGYSSSVSADQHGWAKSVAQYFFGFLSGFSLGPENQLPTLNREIFAGILIFLFAIISLIPRNPRARIIITSGLVSLLFSVIFLVFTSPHGFNVNDSGGYLAEIRIESRTITILTSVLFIILGILYVISELVENTLRARTESLKFNGASQFIFAALLIWFIPFSGWYYADAVATQVRQPFFTGTSQWQSSATRIQSNQSPICVPVDPIEWTWGRNCNLLYSSFTSETDLVFKEVEHQNLVLPSELASNNELVGLLVASKTIGGQNHLISAKLTISLLNGEHVLFLGQKDCSSAGCGIYLTGQSSVKINEITSIELEISPIALIAVQNESEYPETIWYGN